MPGLWVCCRSQHISKMVLEMMWAYAGLVAAPYSEVRGMDACVPEQELSVTGHPLQRRMTIEQGESLVYYLTDQFDDVLGVDCHHRKDHHAKADVYGQE